MSNIVYLKSFRINEKYMMFIQYFKYKLLKFAVIKEACLAQICQKIVFSCYPPCLLYWYIFRALAFQLFSSHMYLSCSHGKVEWFDFQKLDL